jgi:hypothetical protein
MRTSLRVIAPIAVIEVVVFVVWMAGAEGQELLLRLFG